MHGDLSLLPFQYLLPVATSYRIAPTMTPNSIYTMSRLEILFKFCYEFRNFSSCSSYYINKIKYHIVSESYVHVPPHPLLQRYNTTVDPSPPRFPSAFWLPLFP